MEASRRPIEFHLEGIHHCNPRNGPGDFRNLGFPQDAVQEFKLTTGKARLNTVERVVELPVLL